jgi:hypothetical protein
MELPPIEPGDTFAAATIPELPELVVGLMHQETKIAFGGGSKTFKTWQLLNLALSVAQGLDYMGYKTSKGNVLFVNLEIPRVFCQKRAKQVAAARKTELPPNLGFLNLRGRVSNYKSLLPQIRQLIGKKFALLIIDPIYKMYGDIDENSAGDVAQLLNAIEELSVQSGAAVAFAHHFSKGNQAKKEAMDRMSGSGVFSRDPDTILNFTRHEEENCFRVDVDQRNFPPIEPFVVRWDCPLMLPDMLLDPARLRKSSGTRRKFTVDMVLGALGMNIPLSPTALMRELRCSRKTFYETLLPQMEDHPQITRTPDGDWLLANLKGELSSRPVREGQGTDRPGRAWNGKARQG